MIAADTLLIPLMQAFLWFDDGLQSYLQACGWHQVTRPQSMVMASVVIGVHKPADIARNLGLSRQAVHKTILQMVELGMLELKNDDADQRARIVVVSAKGAAMGEDAGEAVRRLVAELRRRIGPGRVDSLIEAFREDWGDAPSDWTDVPSRT